VIDMTVAAYRAIPEVAAVYTNPQLAAVPVPTGDPTKFTLEQRARASFDPQRSGDIIVQLKQWVVPIAHPGGGYVATHGSPWDNDRRVPILFWRKGMTAASRDDPADTVDIMPTLAAMLGLPVTGPIDGRCLTGISGVACPAR
jgi:arylsulfatase A-like enzyme